ncbi:MAG: imidazole glycerol phosphate synthase subunit HisF [Patescibacteria group bacterium]
MFIIPAIDIINGKCVRLVQGNFSDPTVYSNNPIGVAKNFEKQGAVFLHLVDLDGAKSGFPVNLKTVFAIANSVNIPLQIGGGIRSYDQARRYLENGIEKIILSTVALENPKLLNRLIKNFGNSRITVSIDIKDEKIATRGWLKKDTKTISDIVTILKKARIKSVIVTDTSKDGLLKGPNFVLTKQFINAGFAAIAAGGVASLSDIEELNKLGAFGAIVGKALYEKKIDLKKAQRAVAYRNNLAKRIIPCLDVENGRVVKGTNFKNLRDAGDPVLLGKRYSESGADELVYLDISATRENRQTFRELVSQIAKEINIPFTVGGGVSTTEDIRDLLNAGADKISIGSAAVTNSQLIKEAAQYFGSQCVVISVDAKKQGRSWKIYINGGTKKTKIDAIKFSQQMERLGAGELLVNSLDRDGTKTGFDLELLKGITESVNIPMIASSGAGKKEDFLAAFTKGGCDAALAATLFHYGEISILELKKYLQRNNLTVR